MWRTRSRQTPQTGPSVRDARSLPALGDVPRVKNDEHVQQAGHDRERIAIFIGDRDDAAGALAHELGNEIRDADPEIGDGRKPDKRLREIEGKGKNASLEPESGRKHEREDD